MKKISYLLVAIFALSLIAGCVSIPDKKNTAQYSDGKITTIVEKGKCEIYLNGGISSDLPNYIESEINNIKSQNCQKKTLVINSHGGISSAAQKVGRLVRLNNFDTAIRYENQCSSACGLIFISGVNRIIWKPNFLYVKEPRIGFHTPAVKNDGSCMNIDRINQDKRIKATVINIFNYAESMLGRNSALQFTTNMFDTDCKELKLFSVDKLLEQGIATRVGTLSE